MSYTGRGRQQTFWDYQDLPRQQDDVWLRQLPKVKVQNCETNQQLPCE